MRHVPAVFEETAAHDDSVDHIVGRSPVMQEVYKSIGRVAPLDVNVLILGESGTGKELAARAIYHHSSRRDKPYEVIDCAAVPEAQRKKLASYAGQTYKPTALSVTSPSAPAVPSRSAKFTPPAFKSSPLALAADSPVKRGNAPADTPLGEALERLWQMGVGRGTIEDWVQIAEAYRGPEPFGTLGVEQHPVDLSRLMKRVLEWKPRLILESGTELGGTLFLWTRIAAFDCHLIAAGLSERPIPDERLPLFEAFTCGQQSLRNIPRGETTKIDYDINQQRDKRLAYFVFLNGRRPYDELKADVSRCLKWINTGALVAWDGLRQFGFDEKHLSGGIAVIVVK